MKRSHYLLLSTMLAFCLQAAKAQTVTYVNYTAPVFRHAMDQRYSNHKTVFYAADINADLLNNLTSSKVENARDAFMASVMGELKKSGLQMHMDSSDLNVLYMVDNISLSPISNPGMMSGTMYAVEGSMREVVVNRKGEPYVNRTINLSSQQLIGADDKISNDFTKLLSNQKTLDTYCLIVKLVKSYSFEREKQFADGYHTVAFSLPTIYRAKKKYPEFAMLDSLNDALVATLKKKDLTDYAQLVKPYTQTYTDMVTKTYPSDYNTKQVKVAGYSELSFLYYLAYDTVNLKKSLDTLYAFSSKFLGNRLDYDPRASLLKEINEYYASMNYRKYPVDSFTGEVRSDFFATQKLIDNSWVLTTKGDTVKGRLIQEKTKGSMVDLDAGKYVKLEVIDNKGKAVQKSFKVSDLTSFNVGGQKMYEIHKFKPPMVSGGSFNLDALRAKDYPFQVIYTSAKIKILKENFWEEPTNAIVFIRPNESDVANQGKDWQKKRDEMFQTYFKDCPAIQAKLTANTYDFKSDDSYIKMATDYTNGCN